MTTTDLPLTCGCTPTQPCQKAAAIFAKVTHWRGPLYQHLAAGADLPRKPQSMLSAVVAEMKAANRERRGAA